MEGVRTTGIPKLIEINLERLHLSTDYMGYSSQPKGTLISDPQPFPANESISSKGRPPDRRWREVPIGDIDPLPEQIGGLSMGTSVQGFRTGGRKGNWRTSQGRDSHKHI